MSRTYTDQLFALVEGLGLEDKTELLIIVGGIRNEIKAENYREIARLRQIESCARYLLGQITGQQNWENQLDKALKMTVEDYGDG